MAKITEVPMLESPLSSFDRVYHHKLTQEELDRLKSHPLFFQLTTKQQNFVIAFIERKGDGVKAVRDIYRCKGDKSAEAQARSLLKHWMIRRLLAYMGGFSLDGSIVALGEAKQLISDRLRDPSTESNTFAKLLDQLWELQGWSSPKERKKNKDTPKSDDQTSTSVEELVRKLEQKKQKE